MANRATQSAATHTEASPRSLSRTPPRSPARVLQVLFELAGDVEGLSLTRLSEKTGSPKTSLLSLLTALERTGFVVRNGTYRLGPQAHRLGNAIVGRDPFPAGIRRELEKLGAATGETCLIGVLSADTFAARYHDRVESNQPIRFSVEIGSERPLYCTSVGKLLLAFCPRSRQLEYLKSQPLRRYTRSTETNARRILAGLAVIRASGLSVSKEEMVEGAAAVSAVILNRDGWARACVTIAAPVSRLRDNEAALSAQALATGREMSRILGYSGAYPPAGPETA